MDCFRILPFPPPPKTTFRTSTVSVKTLTALWNWSIWTSFRPYTSCFFFLFFFLFFIVISFLSFTFFSLLLTLAPLFFFWQCDTLDGSCACAKKKKMCVLNDTMTAFCHTKVWKRWFVFELIAFGLGLLKLQI